ncbi:MAG: alpha/beta hydrolase [Phenylobacterium sp.]|nr:MAG: alpha/beta hydrolase [Phenylobacterium sp.]
MRLSTQLATTVAALTLCLGSAAMAAPPTRITAQVIGYGPDVILVTGLSSAELTWGAEAARLKDHYRLHLIQIAGFGGAAVGANDAGPVLAPVAAEIDAYIRDNRLQRPAVIGHSLGGLVALELAAAHPKDVSRLMILDSLPFVGLQAGATSAAQLEPQAAAVRAQLTAAPQAAYAATTPATAAQMAASPADQAKVAAAMAASDHRTVADALYDAMTSDLRPALAGLPMPVTVLYAAKSSAGLPQAASDALYAKAYADVPHHSVQRVDGAAHFLMLDQPAAFDAAVQAFLAAK